MRIKDFITNYSFNQCCVSVCNKTSVNKHQDNPAHHHSTTKNNAFLNCNLSLSLSNLIKTIHEQYFCQSDQLCFLLFLAPNQGICFICHKIPLFHSHIIPLCDYCFSCLPFLYCALFAYSEDLHLWQLLTFFYSQKILSFYPCFPFRIVIIMS